MRIETVWVILIVLILAMPFVLTMIDAEISRRKHEKIINEIREMGKNYDRH